MTAGIPKQRGLGLKITVFAPLMKVDAVRSDTLTDREDVLELVQTGAIAWSLNIGLGEKRSELRLLAKSVSGYLATGVRCNLEGETKDRVVAYILSKESKPEISARRLAFLFCCERKLIVSLIEAGELTEVGNRHRGNAGRTLITRVSVEKFLKRRMR